MFRCFLMKLLIFFFFIKPLIIMSQDILHPEKIMKNITNRIFIRFKHENDTICRNPNYIRIIIREEFLPYVHIRYIGSTMLGKYYQSINQKQKEYYFFKFSEYLEYMYSQILASFYFNHKYYIEHKNIFQNENTAITRVTIMDNIFPIHLDFQWKKNLSAKKWKICNITIEGIGMLETKKEEWVSLLEDGGIENLIKHFHTISNQPIKIKRELYSKKKD